MSRAGDAWGCGRAESLHVHDVPVSWYPGRWLVTVGCVVWGVAVLYLAACLVSPSLAGAAGCELAPGSSVFGDASRSWLPPGTTCTYDLSGYGLPADVVVDPSPLRFAVVGVVLAGPPALLHVHRLLARRTPLSA